VAPWLPGRNGAEWSRARTLVYTTPLARARSQPEIKHLAISLWFLAVVVVVPCPSSSSATAIKKVFKRGNGVGECGCGRGFFSWMLALLPPLSRRTVCCYLQATATMAATRIRAVRAGCDCDRDENDTMNWIGIGGRMIQEGERVRIYSCCC
jgi:hypothetical protein